jgi:hypothetical protein
LSEAANGQQREPDPWGAAAEPLPSNQIGRKKQVNREQDERNDIDDTSIRKHSH